MTVPVSEFAEKAESLLNSVKYSEGSAFAVPNIEEFMKRIKCSKIKGTSWEKRDITMVLEDPKLGNQPELGFSIKSKLGNPSTLLNAGRTTNFIYEIKNLGLDEELISEINSIEGHSKIQDRIRKIEELGGILEYFDMSNNTFKHNLKLIDSQMPEIISKYLYVFYTNSLSKISALTDKLLEFEDGDSKEAKRNFYETKIRQFLRNVALGMTPTNEWDTENEVTGGFIVVKETGEILCYHIYNKKSFESYLMENTKFETPSSGRHAFGTVYLENGKAYFNLNLQVRFIR
jgi:hypothetical protein